VREWPSPTRGLRAGETPTNGHGGPTAVEHVGEDIIVWRAPDDDAPTRSSPSATTVPAATRSSDADDADAWLGVGGARFVNLHFIVGALKRRRRWLIGFAGAGLAVGLVLSVKFAPSPRAETTVLLTHPSTSARTPAMVTDSELLATNAVARRAVDALHLAESPTAFASSYKGTVLSDDLLGISVAGSSGPDAVRRANTLAREYLRYRADVYQRQSEAVIQGLQDRQAGTQSQLDQLAAQLGPKAALTTSTDPATAALLAQRDSLDEELTTLSSAIVEQSSSTQAVIDGSSAIDEATPVEQSLVKEVGRNALSGLVAGLGLGLALIVVLALTSNRVWRRDDVAEAMRHSVDLSTGRVRIRRRRRRRTIKRLIARPTPELAKIVAHVRDQLATRAASDRSLAVLAVGGLEVAAAAVCATAVALARDGWHVVVVDASEPGIVSALRLVDERESETALSDARGHIRVVPLTNGGDALSTDDDEIVLVLATVDPGQGAEDIRLLAPTAVAIVSAGHTTMAALRGVSDMLEAARLELASVVFVGSSPQDESFGRTADREASAPAPGEHSHAWLASAAGQ
jgi:uncharacterized protein involved in exopolysaccharide biosynthesis